jgi:hypothetical protein
LRFVSGCTVATAAAIAEQLFILHPDILKGSHAFARYDPPGSKWIGARKCSIRQPQLNFQTAPGIDEMGVEIDVPV